MVANHCCCIAIPTREDRQPPTCFIHRNQRLHHISRLLRGNDIVKRMNSTIGIPHGVIAIVSTRFYSRRRIDGDTICKLWIGAIYIAHLTRQERGTIQGTIKLIYPRSIFILHIDGMQSGSPLRGHILHHAIKIVHLCLKGKVALCALFGSKGCCSFQDDRLMGFAVKSKPGTETIATRICNFIVSLQQEMATETSRLAPTLIDAMHRVIAINGLRQIVDFQIALTLIAIMIQDDMHWSVLLWGNTEDSRMTTTRHFYPQMLLRQAHRIIMRMGNLLIMRERRSSLFWS